MLNNEKLVKIGAEAPLFFFSPKQSFHVRFLLYLDRVVDCKEIHSWTDFFVSYSHFLPFLQCI